MAGEYIEVSNNARNIGATVDTHMNLEKYVVNTCKTAFYHLRNIARMRNCLSQDETEILVHAFHLSWTSVTTTTTTTRFI